jgi:integral membrane protein (TIGR01906 family)
VRASWILSAATAVVILGASVAAFLNPVWVGAEQARLGVGRTMGIQLAGGLDCPTGELSRIAGSILHDLVLGGDFEVRLTAQRIECNPVDVPATGAIVLTDAERSHMRDVRGVFAGFGVLVLVSIAWLVVHWRASAGDRAAWWRAVRRGAGGLAVVVAVVAAVSLVAFDAAFEVFHRLFFAAGTYDFDPRTSRLVQLFPDQFWSDTTMALGSVVLAASLLIRWMAGRRLGRADPAPAAGTPSLQVGKVV